MKLQEIIDKEELQLDTDKIRQNYKICVSKLGDRLEQFIDKQDLDDGEIRILYRYNEFLKQNCRR